MKMYKKAFILVLHFHSRNFAVKSELAVEVRIFNGSPGFQWKPGFSVQVRLRNRSCETARVISEGRCNVLTGYVHQIKVSTVCLYLVVLKVS